MMSSEIINNVRRWGCVAQEIQESNNKIENLKNLEQNLSLIDVGGENLCFDEMVSGGLFFDELDGGDSCFDADWFMGCLDSDQENSNKIENLEQNLSLIDVGGGNLCFDEMVSGGLWLDELDGGDSCFDAFEIDWFMGYLDSDQENRKKMNLEETIGENLSLMDSGSGDICFDQLGGGDFFFDNFDIDWFMGYLDSDQVNNDNMIDSDVGNNLEESWVSTSEILGLMDLAGGDLCFNELDCGDFFVDNFDSDWLMGYLDSDEEEISKKMNIEGIGFGNYVEESRTLTAESFLVMDSGDADCSVSDQRKIGGFCSDDINIDWLMRCLDSDKEEDLRCDDLDSFIAILDSNQEEPLEHRTMSKLGKRKFEADEYSNQTKKKCLL
ncbi:hypothetical protein POM88_036128 [Heracleum sosnowskyi]|uniref:Uncharacterized protein n=1 Tax=Heracleum sosnowskyi TaxID=360622 RepID=A0AAD8MDX7_9APIA|nr:hypothetical protein POM88_036128 [Heracleum sosnowskyi]